MNRRTTIKPRVANRLNERGHAARAWPEHGTVVKTTGSVRLSVDEAEEVADTIKNQRRYINDLRRGNITEIIIVPLIEEQQPILIPPVYFKTTSEVRRFEFYL